VLFVVTELIQSPEQVSPGTALCCVHSLCLCRILRRSVVMCALGTCEQLAELAIASTGKGCYSRLSCYS
jgi:hypothetical protein